MSPPKCEYACEAYGVPADIGRRVVIDNMPGIIAADRGSYIGVNFDEHKPGVISNCHPTWRVEYQEMGQVRNVTASQRRYRRYLRVSDQHDGFIAFCRWDTWNETKKVAA